MRPCSDASRRFYLAFHSWSRTCQNQQCAHLRQSEHPIVKQHCQSRTISVLGGPNALLCRPQRVARAARVAGAKREERGGRLESKRDVQTAAIPTYKVAAYAEHEDVHKEIAHTCVSALKRIPAHGDAQAEADIKVYELPTEVSAQKTHHGETASRSESLDAYRGVLASMVNPVVVLTACDAAAEGAALSHPTNHWHGATLSSFTSLSMEPAYVTFNIAENSRTLAAIRSQEIQRAVIHIMHDTLEGQDMARVFSAQHDKSHAPFEIMQDGGYKMELRSAGPNVIHPHAVRARLECISVEDCVVKTIAGKHICVLRVDRLFLQDSQLGDNSGFSLSYADRDYVSVSHSLLQKVRGEKPPGGVSVLRRPRAVGSANFSTRTQSRYSDTRTHGTSRAYSTRRNRAPYTPTQDAPATTPLASEGTLHQTSDESRTISMSETVDDYLAQAPTGRGRQLKEIITTQRHVIQALSRKARGQPELPRRKPNQEIIDDSGGKIKRFLAMAAVEDLEKMLDAGRVAPSRIQFIEATIEQGQLALIEAGHKLMKVIDERGIEGAENEWLNRKRLLAEEDRMRTALHRLREFVEDDDGDTFDDDD